MFYHRNFNRELARLTLQGRNISNPSNMDERGYQKAIVEGFPTGEGPEVVVLGSSRSMGIYGSLFGDGRFFNNSLSGAEVQDLIAIWQMYKTNGIRPGTVVLGVDPWIFNANNHGIPWTTLGRYYDEFVGGNEGFVTLLGDRLSRYSELLSFEYVEVSISRLKKMIRGEITGFYLIDDDSARDPVHTTRLADGAIVYSRAERGKSQSEVDAEAREYAQRSPIYQLGGFTGIDPAYRELFVSLVRDMLSEGTEVIFWLPPYHPVAYARIDSDPAYRMVGKVEDLLRSFAAGLDIAVLGSYDPSEAGVPAGDFLDGMHLRREGYPVALGPLQGMMVGHGETPVSGMGTGSEDRKR